MARNRFGGTASDFVFATYRFGGHDLVQLATAQVTCWSAPPAVAGRVQYTDLRLLDGTAVSTVQANADGSLPEFDGPNAASVTRLWVSADGGATGVWLTTSSIPSTPADIGADPAGTAQQLLDALVASAPGALDTLNELAAALGDDPNYAATVTQQLAAKLNSADLDASTAPLVDDPATDTGARLAATYARVFTPAAYGAVGDGVADDTAAIQAAVDDCTVGGVVDGQGKTYLVTAVNLKSDIEFRNFRLLAKTPGENLVSPVTIGAYYDTNLRQNITIRNVHVDGQRALQDGDLTGTEDGGRCGFRFIGPIENLLMEDCSANFTACDGLELHSGQGMEAIKQYDRGIQRHIRANRCTFTFNRRHGAALDACDDVVFTDCKFTDNGGAVEGITTGAQPLLLGGIPFGAAVDIEEYDNTTYCADIHFIRCEALRNQRGSLFYMGTAARADDPNWVTRTGFTFDGGTWARGVHVDAGPAAIEITPDGANKNLGWYYDDVQFNDVRFDGVVVLRSVETARHQGGRVTTDFAALGTLDVGGSMYVAGVERGGKKYDLANASAEYADASAGSLWVPAAQMTASETDPTRTLVNRWDTWVFSDGQYDAVSFLIDIPADWDGLQARVRWFNNSAAAGTVGWAINAATAAVGDTNVAPTSQIGATSDAGTQGVIMETVLALGPLTGPVLYEILRDGPGDTLAGDAALIGVELTRTT